MDKRAYSFKSSATYRAGPISKRSRRSLWPGRRLWLMTRGGDFQASFPDIFAQYQNPPLTGSPVTTSNKALNSWKTTPFDWWQCQLNFALWCATAGCGVSADDHLQAKDPLLSGLYRFHVYYTTRRLLVELKVALPGDKSYSWYENAYDAGAYKRLCNGFGVAPSTDWRQKLDNGWQGLGSWSTYMEPSGAYRHSHYSDGRFYHPKDAIRHNRDIYLFIYTMFKEDDTISYKITSLPCGPLKYKQAMYIYIFTKKTML